MLTKTQLKQLSLLYHSIKENNSYDDIWDNVDLLIKAFRNFVTEENINKMSDELKEFVNDYTDEFNTLFDLLTDSINSSEDIRQRFTVQQRKIIDKVLKYYWYLLFDYGYIASKRNSKKTTHSSSKTKTKRTVYPRRNQIVRSNVSQESTTSAPDNEYSGSESDAGHRSEAEESINDAN